jgi:hypothetical protein
MMVVDFTCYLGFLTTKVGGEISFSHKQQKLIQYEILAEALPGEKGTDTRATKRIFSFLQIIPLAKAHLRHKLALGTDTLVIAALEDLGQVLHITLM